MIKIHFGNKTFYGMLLLWASLLNAAIIAPLVVVIYPFEVVFASSDFSQNVLIWTMISFLALSFILGITSFFRGKLILSIAYFSPFFEVTVMMIHTSYTAMLFALGFNFFTFPQTAFYRHCQLHNYTLGQKNYSPGICLETVEYQTIPGQTLEKSMIVYDSSHFLGAIYSASNSLWLTKLREFIPEVAYGEPEMIYPIEGNYYYVDLSPST